MKTTRRGFVSALAGLSAAQVVRAQNLPFEYLQGEPLRIGNQTQLLADDFIIEDRWKLTRRVGRVMKHARNPVVVGDKPWEEAVGGRPAVLYDDKLGKYRMWYTCFSLSNYFSRNGPSYYIGYAESSDAFNWVKPELEGFPFRGYPRTNIVTAGREGKRASSAQVMFNPDQSDPARRFLMVYIGNGLVDLAYSPDGLHWDIEQKPLFRYHSDCPNHLVWLPERNIWHLYVRPPIRPNGPGAVPEGLRHTGRRLALATSRDLKNWSMPRTIFYPDERDEPDYDNVYVFRRHGMFLGLIGQMFQERGGPEESRAAYDPDGSSSETATYLATSRDGIHWERTWDRAPFIPRGQAGSFDHGQLSPGTSPPVEMGEEMLIYYYASPRGQSHWYSETSVGLARFRRDRFIGQWAGEQTGYLLTRQFILDGSALELNCTALPIPYHRESDGIRVAIIEAPDFQSPETRWEKAVPGFAMEDCERVAADSLAFPVKWKGNSDLSHLKGRHVYLRFQMKQATLYSFRILP